MKKNPLKEQWETGDVRVQSRETWEMIKQEIGWKLDIKSEMKGKENSLKQYCEKKR